MAAVPGILRQWNPGIIPGLRSWYGAADTKSLTFSTPSNISQFNDKSGYRTHHLSQTSSNNQPRLATINNTQCVSFLNSNIFMSTIGTGLGNGINSTGYSHLMVMRVLSNINYPGTTPLTATNIYNFNNSNNTTRSGANYTGGVFIFTQLNESTRPQLTANSGINFINQTYYDNKNSNITIVLTSNSVANNSVKSQPLNGLLSNVTTYYIGSDPNYRPPNGVNIGEVIVFSNCYFNSNYVTPQVQQVEGYFAWKWGLTNQLSNDHPYKRRPPT